MKSITKSFLVILSLLILNCFLLGFWLNPNLVHLLPKPQTRDNFNTMGFEPLRGNLDKIIKDQGVAKAARYVDFDLHKGGIDMDQCHILMHLVGHAAYRYYANDWEKVIKDGGGLICMDSYYHGVEGEIALSRDGSYVDRLKDFCGFLRRHYDGISCYHGAGHSFFTASFDAAASLLKCDSLEGGPDPDLSDCWRGVFSEYANLALNYDGQTGRQYGEKAPISIDLKKPLLECEKFEQKYKDSCFSQVSKVLYNQDVDVAIASCLNAGYSQEAVNICVYTVAAQQSRRKLIGDNTIVPTAAVFALSPEARRKYVSGVVSSFVAYKIDGITKDLESFCNSFKIPEETLFCSQSKGDIKE